MDQHVDLLCRKLVCFLYRLHSAISDLNKRAVKMSILALYYRIGHGRKGLPWIVQAPAVWTVAGFMTAFGLSSFMVSFGTFLICLPCDYRHHELTTLFQAQLFLCVPVSRIWDIVHVNDGGCIDVSEFMITSAAINVTTDIILLLFPLPLLRLFTFNRRQRSKSADSTIALTAANGGHSGSGSRSLYWPYTGYSQHYAALRNHHGRQACQTGTRLAGE